MGELIVSRFIIMINMFWMLSLGLAYLCQSASISSVNDTTIINVGKPTMEEFNAVLKEDKDGWLEENNELFPIDFVRPLKRQLSLDIDIKPLIVPGPEVVNNTQLFDPSQLMPLKKRSAEVEDRATTDCGCGGAPAAGRIVGGAEVSPMHSRPYQAYLQSCSSQGCAMCGATLINKRYALTAMHCVVGATNLVVSLGEHNIAGNIETISPQTIKVDSVIKRSDYTETDVNNDIAILKLSQEVVFNSNVVPACLPTDASRTYTGYSAYVSGWGTTQESGSTSNVLKVTQQKILPNTDQVCVTGSMDNPVPNSKMCAYLQGTDSCQGDSGGPLTVQEDGRWTIVGVVSYGIGCARTGYAGVYARVTNYLNWINQNVADGWCGSSVTTTTAAPTTSSSSTAGPVCDLTCTNVGTLTGDVSLNSRPSRCDGGYCHSTDGSDLCAMFGHPCGQTTTSAPTYSSPLKCSRPCNLKPTLDSIRSQVSTDTINVSLNGIPSICDMRTNYCCATDYLHSDLCYRLGVSSGK